MSRHKCHQIGLAVENTQETLKQSRLKVLALQVSCTLNSVGRVLIVEVSYINRFPNVTIHVFCNMVQGR